MILSLTIDFLIDRKISSYCPDLLEAWLLTPIILHKLNDEILGFFDNLLYCVDYFYGMKVDKRS